MSHVNFKKIAMSHVYFFSSQVVATKGTKAHVTLANLINSYVTLSILGVNGHSLQWCS